MTWIKEAASLKTNLCQLTIVMVTLLNSCTEEKDTATVVVVAGVVVEADALDDKRASPHPMLHNIIPEMLALEADDQGYVIHVGVSFSLCVVRVCLVVQNKLSIYGQLVPLTSA